MLPVDRCYRFIERSTGFREHWKGREVVSAGGACGADHGVTPLTLMTPRAALVAVIVGTEFFELTARPVQSRSRFLITDVTSWSFCRVEKTRLSVIPDHY